MGDRALVIIHDKQRTEYSPVVYFHWAGGEGVAACIEVLKKCMGDRTDDVSYATARFIGCAHSIWPGNTSLGVFNLSKDFKDTPEYWSGLSHGDAGVVLVDAETYETRCYGGYGLPAAEVGTQADVTV